MSSTDNIDVQVLGRVPETAADILSPDALRFVGFLCHQFEDRRQALLKQRETLSASFDAREKPHFQHSPEVDSNEWTCAQIPDDLLDRRVEITGPVDRKMVINGLNSGANVYMADFEDSSSPTWENMIQGQRNLRDAVAGTISFTNARTGKVYKLKSKTSVLFARPRGWHLDEAHLLINGRIASGSILDFGLYFYHNVQTLLKQGTAPYFYLPKLEGRLEARLWNDVFVAGK